MPSTRSASAQEIPAIGCNYDVVTLGLEQVLYQRLPNGISSATAEFLPREEFMDGTDLCVRARVGVTAYSDPACGISA